nr:G protein alpha-a subunit [Biomphalaria glabrata]
MNKSGRSAIARSKSIDQLLDEDREKREREIQILILGAPATGKSTFIKQFRLHYGDRFPQSERRTFHDQIHQNVAFSLVHLMDHMERLGLKFHGPSVQKLAEDFRKKHPRISLTKLTKKFKEENEKAEVMCPVTTRAELTKRLSSLDVYQPEVPNIDDMHTLWADTAMQIGFEKRHTFETDKLTFSSEYFLNHIGRICHPNYLASVQDILLIRWPSLGVQEHQFIIDNFLYRMIDVAGQRSLRKKWIHFFDEVTVVTFFVNLAAFDEYSEEDPTVNSLYDSLQAFIEIVHSHFLDKTDFILFFNKKDLFASKIKTSSLSQCFSNFKAVQHLPFLDIELKQNDNHLT